MAGLIIPLYTTLAQDTSFFASSKALENMYNKIKIEADKRAQAHKRPFSTFQLMHMANIYRQRNPLLASMHRKSTHTAAKSFRKGGFIPHRGDAFPIELPVSAVRSSPGIGNISIRGYGTFRTDFRGVLGKNISRAYISQEDGMWTLYLDFKPSPHNADVDNYDAEEYYSDPLMQEIL